MGHMTNSKHGAPRSGRGIPNLAHTPSNQPLHATAFTNRRLVLRAALCLLIALFAFAGTAGAAVYSEINSTITSHSVVITSQKTKKAETEILDPNSGKPINLLVMGQDSRDGAENSALGNGIAGGEHNADTTMIAQISADRSYVNLVSIPRDTLVDVPACTTSKGTIPARYNVMFNSIFAYGYNRDGLSGAATCAMAAIESLTGIHLDQFIIVDFAGMKKMIDAIGGVDVCIAENVNDEYTGLRLNKGLDHLDGTSGTMFARIRHGIGDGSDIGRTARQQYLIKQLLRQIKQKNILLNVNELYGFAKSALESLTMSSGLGQLGTLTGLAYSMRHFSVSNLYSRTAPIMTAPNDPNRVVFSDAAKTLWELMRAGKPINVDLSADAQTQADQLAQESAQSKSEADKSTSSDNSSDTSSNSSESTDSSDQQSEQNAAKPDPITGLISQSDGSLVDPRTGGVVDPETGVIRDAQTGSFMGIADRYLNHTICGIPADKL